MAAALRRLHPGEAVTSSRSRSGTAFAPWLLILLMLGSIFWLLNRLNTQLREANGCQTRLENIHHVLTLYEREFGVLPSFDLFPEDPQADPAAMREVLEPYGLDPDWLVCPAAPRPLASHGNTYLWNTALNQSSLRDRLEITWVLVDIQALDDKLAGPHFGAYHILYTDGRVERGYQPPHSLPVQFD